MEADFNQHRPDLEAGVAGLGLSADSRQIGQMLDYLKLMARWNRAYNLTAVDEPAEMVARHLLDSVAIQPWLQGRLVLDAGTGAGLPGVPLAIVCPERHFLLVDGNGKKIRFLRQVRRELGLENIEPIQSRLEDLDDATVPDCIVARALAPLARLVEWTERWLAQGATLLAMKGDLSESERAALPDTYNVNILDLEVPRLRARRCLAIITRK